MHSHSLEHWQHDHTFLGEKHEIFEKRTWGVVALTLAMMVAEIAGGVAYGSMALTADGLHMATHAGALAIAAVAYSVARRHARSARFSYGTGKLGELAAFASALILAMIALLIAYESVARLLAPVTIRFDEALVIAAVGLAVNLASAWLLYDQDHHRPAQQHHHHAHHSGDESHGHVHEHAHHVDHNARAAYVHVLADALTSVLAIAALLCARAFGWTWIDPIVGLLGTLVILAWSWTLIVSSGAVLLDMVPSAQRADAIRQRLEHGDDRVTDLHVWRLGPGHLGVTASIVSDHPQPPDHYKARLADIEGLSHVIIEVQPCAQHG
jgi:cation diffusion facilitator family transporter